MTIPKINKQWLFLLGAAIVIFVLITFFAKILVYILIAFIVSLLGRPLVAFLNKKLKFPNLLACIVVMLLFFGILFLFFWGVFPLIFEQADAFRKINFPELKDEIMLSLQPIQQKMWDYGLMQEEHTLEEYTINYLTNFVSAVNFESIFSNIVGVITSIFIGIFAVFFISFFFLRDRTLFKTIFMLFIPKSFEEKTERILQNSHTMLYRYFGGCLLDILIYMIVLSSTLAILGVKSPILIGFIAGICNFVPYIGPVMGCAIACILTYISAISGGYTAEIMPLFIKIICTFIVCNMLDAFLLQPNIYSKSVKAHPLEIFLVILLSGQLFGVLGMIFAIPLYTLFRIIAKEFFTQSKLVNKITEQL
jgi:predicted PurR-regulated permease PerM